MRYKIKKEMGIKCLKQLIRKHAPDAIKLFNIESLKGKKVAIDSSILLYKFRYMYSTDDFHIRGFNQKIKEFEKLGIHPVFVFDGKPPAAKQAVLTQRKEHKIKMKDRLEVLTKNFKELNVEVNFQEFINDSDSEIDTTQESAKKIHLEIQKIKKNLLYVNKNHSLEVIELLKDLGIPFFESYGEAEEMCVILQKQGTVEYILTEDTDSLAFGGTNVVVQRKDSFEIIYLDIILNSFGLNFYEFVDMCILCGCDYTCKIQKIGPTSALKIIKEYRNIDNFIEKQIKWVIPDSFNYNLARSLFLAN